MVGYFRLVREGKLVKLDATGAYFSGLTVRRVNDDQIDGYLSLRNRADGSVREEKSCIAV